MSASNGSHPKSNPPTLLEIRSKIVTIEKIDFLKSETNAREERKKT
ncbi:hypothetical protein CCACVL1_12178 [Corchorus capsularis]|uniref:Uncharacterized protein n=1 Tax=Corchorus capsularis TaxID=210143 RepID=A0A1R3IH40_COCAP|nr:hypothetical protein CCACVL1_12178 [Corchorus capsularis]